MEKILLSDVQTKIYPDLEKSFLDMLHNSGYKDVQFEKKVNSETVVWQNVETEYWINFLRKLILEHSIETGSTLSKSIINNYEAEVKNFIQVCPKEMIGKLKNPISFNTKIKKVS